jgi:hypothetical protein
MDKLTLCFYEYPAALHEIEEWEKSKIKTIIKKEKSEDNRIDYLIRISETEKEILICFPQHYLNGCDLNKEIYNLLTINLYNKTLLFGKFNSKQLRFISIIIEKYENFKNE